MADTQATAIIDLAQLTERLEAERVERSKSYAVTYLQGPQKGRQFRLSKSETTLGRGDECDVRIDEPSVSRLHATILLGANGRLQIRDSGSRNGIFVNGFWVAPGGIAPLSEGATLRLGDDSALRISLIDDVDEQLQSSLYEAAVKDPLTGTFNKRYLRENLDRELALAVRHNLPLSLIVFDVDHFKGINDKFGHTCGDIVLTELARLVSSAIRTEDLLCRFGGEEFVIVIKNQNLEKAKQLAERVRACIDEATFLYEGAKVPVTVSLGVTSTSLKPYSDVDQMLRDADSVLYEAKRAGRNCWRSCSVELNANKLPLAV